MSASNVVQLPYTPRQQFIPFHVRAERMSIMVCHRRAGKTVAAINDLIAKALKTGRKRARYAYVAPTYRQAKDIAWDYLKEGSEGVCVKISESMLRVELVNGARITLYGADNPDALRGLYFDGVVLDEYGDCRPSLWGKVIRPAIADRKGWVLFIGTPKGKNHFFKMWERAGEQPERWYRKMLDALTSGILDDEELNDMRLDMDDEEWEQEMLCNFAAEVKGTFYSRYISQLENAGAIPKLLPALPNIPVKVSSDLGRRDDCSWWFWQETPEGIRVIDYYENSGEHIDHYIQVLKAKRYQYDAIYLPHDAKAKTLATKRSVIEHMLAADLPCHLVPKLDLQDGITAARAILPYCKFAGEACADGIESLRAYKRKWDEVKQRFADEPIHNWASNGADAFRYLALVCEFRGARQLPAQMARDPLPEAGVDKKYVQPYTLDGLYAARAEVLSLNRFSRGRI